MVKITFNDDLCKGCALCVISCPKKLIALNSDKINKKGFHPAKIDDISSCTACKMCAVMCPDIAIKIEKE